MSGALRDNRFARDQRGQLFDLATGRDVSEDRGERDSGDLSGERRDELALVMAEVLDAAQGPTPRVVAIGTPVGVRDSEEDAWLAAEAARSGFVPVSLAGLRRLPAAGFLARRSAVVMEPRASAPGIGPRVDGAAVVLALTALTARPLVVIVRACDRLSAETGVADWPRVSLAMGGSHARQWQVTERRAVASTVPAVPLTARLQRKMQAARGFHRRRGARDAYLETSLCLAEASLARAEPAVAGRVAREARSWRGWWTDPAGVGRGTLSVVLALLDVQARAELASSVADGPALVDEIGAGHWVARALRLDDEEVRLSSSLAAIHRRAGRFEEGRRVLGTSMPERVAPLTGLRWVRETLWIAMASGEWDEAGLAVQELRELMASGPGPVAAMATLEVATFHLRIGDVVTARALLEQHRRSLSTLTGPERARHAHVRAAIALRTAAPAVEAHDVGARRSARWLALKQDYSLLLNPRRAQPVAAGAAQNVVQPGGRYTGRMGECAMEDVLDLLRVCHDGDDDRRALGQMCVLVRERLGATAVGVWATRHPEPLAGAGNGRSWPLSVAERARTTGLPHGPEPSGSAIEAAWPVTHAGTPIGALACRWLVDHPIDRARAEMMLRAAAAACVPLVRGTIDATAQETPASAVEVFGLVGNSEAMQLLRQGIQRAAFAPFHVLIEGESGSGKELVARAIHTGSSRRHKRFCAINCAALTDELLEAELFGHTRGAFTGALAERPGLFEEASGGTLFLDEVADLSPRGQAKVLRVLQEGDVRRIGENFSRRVDVRVVAASNKSLPDEVARGRFRQDLLYRLDVLRLTIPPLRERGGDVALLAAHFWRDAATRVGSRAVLDGAVLAALAGYDWPGNVRELQNVMATMAVHAPARGRVGLAALPRSVLPAGANAPVATLEQARRQFDAQYVRHALARAGGSRAEAARTLGLTRQGLAKLVDRLGLERGQNAVPRLLSSP